MASNNTRKHAQSFTGKIILASLLAATTIFFLWSITKVSFSEMLGTVNNLSLPDPKLKLVNNIFRSVVHLDHLQRTQALRLSDKPYSPILRESFHLNAMLDTLRVMSGDDSGQLSRVESMKRVLQEWDRQFLNYLKLRTDLIRNDTLTAQIRSLSEGFAARAAKDSLVATNQKITTIVLAPSDSVIVQEKERQSIWNKLFGRKKTQEAVKMQKFITTELDIRIDTLALAKDDSAVQKLGMIIEDVEKKRLIRRDVLVKRQGQMIATSGLLISQLFNILQDIETEELARAEQNTVEATEVVNTGITRMNTLLILFILGAAILALLIFTDISRSNKYRRQLLAAKEEAEYTGQVKQRFLANMSHELRTPLQAIAGIAEQMKLNAQAKPKEIDIVYHSSQHLLQIVNEVLDYSKIVSGSFQIDQHPFDIHAVMAEVCAIMEVRAEQKGLSFRYNPGFSGSGAFVGDSFRLKQILFNLIGNAIKFTNEGSITFTVVQEDFKAQSLFRFIVKDTGIGMSDEEMQRMFTQFEQGATIPDYQHNGTGLGLSIVRELVDIQQGTIQSESSPGKGTVFTVELSYQRARQAPAQISERSSLTHQTFKGVVWIVDDDAYILELCRSILNKQGIKHRCFSTPGAVLRALPDAQVSLVFLDIRMPEMSGFDLHRRMKEKLPARYIALTAQALPEERSEILEKGFDGLLMKPFLEHDLLQQIYATEAVQSTEETSLRFDKLQSMAGDDQKVMQNLLQSFADTTEADLVQLQSSIERKAAAEAADLLHRLAGRSGQFGYKELMLHFRKAELLLRKVPDLDDPLSQELEALIIETRALLRRDDSPLRKK